MYSFEYFSGVHSVDKGGNVCPSFIKSLILHYQERKWWTSDKKDQYLFSHSLSVQLL